MSLDVQFAGIASADTNIHLFTHNDKLYLGATDIKTLIPDVSAFCAHFGEIKVVPFDALKHLLQPDLIDLIEKSVCSQITEFVGYIDWAGIQMSVYADTSHAYVDALDICRIYSGKLNSFMRSILDDRQICDRLVVLINDLPVLDAERLSEKITEKVVAWRQRLTVMHDIGTFMFEPSAHESKRLTLYTNSQNTLFISGIGDCNAVTRLYSDNFYTYVIATDYIAHRYNIKNDDGVLLMKQISKICKGKTIIPQFSWYTNADTQPTSLLTPLPQSTPDVKLNGINHGTMTIHNVLVNIFSVNGTFYIPYVDGVEILHRYGYEEFIPISCMITVSNAQYPSLELAILEQLCEESFRESVINHVLCNPIIPTSKSIIMDLVDTWFNKHSTVIVDNVQELFLKDCAYAYESIKANKSSFSITFK